MLQKPNQCWLWQWDVLIPNCLWIFSLKNALLRDNDNASKVIRLWFECSLFSPISKENGKPAFIVNLLLLLYSIYSGTLLTAVHFHTLLFIWAQQTYSSFHFAMFVTGYATSSQTAIITGRAVEVMWPWTSPVSKQCRPTTMLILNVAHITGDDDSHIGTGRMLLICNCNSGVDMQCWFQWVSLLSFSAHLYSTFLP